MLTIEDLLRVLNEVFPNSIGDADLHEPCLGDFKEGTNQKDD